MKIIIIGSGVAGSVLARTLSDEGYNVVVLEKSKRAGGMCKSYYYKGFTYEYGPHILANHHASVEVEKFIKKHINTEKTKLTSASFVKNKICYYPPSIHSAEVLGLKQKVLKEITNLPKKIDDKNFETYLLGKVGPTLYNNFFKNFTSKFWRINPKKISSDWAKTRKLGESLYKKQMFFNDKWCSYPKNDWNELFVNLLKNINIIYDVKVKRVNLNKKYLVINQKEKIHYDQLISTINIDELFDYKYGKLYYAGYDIVPKIIDLKKQKNLDGKAISMLYYPESKYKHCRITNYGTFQNKKSYPYNSKTILTIETPNAKKRLYPLLDDRNIKIFDKYLIEASKQKNLITFGRLGLYKYLTTDTTVAMVFRLKKFFKNWQEVSSSKRYDFYKTIRGSWKN